jgi:hypothetical protein
MKSRSPSFLVVAPYLPRPASLHAGGRATAAWLAQLARRGQVDLVAMGTVADAQAAPALWPMLHDVEVVRYRLAGRMAGALADLRRAGRVACMPGGPPCATDCTPVATPSRRA